MPKSSTTHTLYRAEIQDIGPELTNDPIDRPRLVLRVITERWELRIGVDTVTNTQRLCWYVANNTLPHCRANDAGSPGLVYPQGWHPSEVAAVRAYGREQHDKVQRFAKLRAKAKDRLQLASDWLHEEPRGSR